MKLARTLAALVAGGAAALTLAAPAASAAPLVSATRAVSTTPAFSSSASYYNNGGADCMAAGAPLKTGIGVYDEANDLCSTVKAAKNGSTFDGYPEYNITISGFYITYCEPPAGCGGNNITQGQFYLTTTLYASAAAFINPYANIENVQAATDGYPQAVAGQLFGVLYGASVSDNPDDLWHTSS